MHALGRDATVSLHGVPNWATYMASKAGLGQLADSLRAEEADKGVAVTSVHPGATATPMLKAGMERRGQPWQPERYIDPAALADLVADCVARPRTAYAARISVALRP